MQPSLPPSKPHITLKIILGLVLTLAVIAATAVFLMHRSQPTATASAATKCLSKQLTVGASGPCVQDVQTMIDYMETSSTYTQCPFPGGATVPTSGNFDDATAQQVSVVQNWLVCFDKEEGITPPTFTAGTMDSATWGELCTYAYTYPLKNSGSSSPYKDQTLASGKDAGCDTYNSKS